MRIKSGSTYRERYRDGVSCAQWLQLVSGFVYLLIAHHKAPLWPVRSECTFPAPSTLSRHNTYEAPGCQGAQASVDEKTVRLSNGPALGSNCALTSFPI